MPEPNLDLGLEYTGGIAKPTKADVGRYARVALDGAGDPNFEYASDVERRIKIANASLTGTVAKTQVIALWTVPAATFGSASQRLRVVVTGQLPARVGTKIGIDVTKLVDGLPAGSIQMDLSSVIALPAANTVFRYEALIHPAGLTGQRIYGGLDVSLQTPVWATALDPGADFNFEQSVRVTAQLGSAGDVITFHTIEIFAIGL